MLLSRRKFVTAGASLTAATALASPLYGRSRVHGDFEVDDDTPITDNPLVKSMMQAGLEAANKSGATYADARLTHTRNRSTTFGISPRMPKGNTPNIWDTEEISVGFRASIGGFWGFSAGPVWSVEEAIRLGKQAAEQARAYSLGKAREFNLIPHTPVREGKWEMPVEIDAFSLHPNELWDRLFGLAYICLSKRGVADSQIVAHFARQDKAFASTEGSYLVQRTFNSSGELNYGYTDAEGRQGGSRIDTLSITGQGFELFGDKEISLAVDASYEEMLFDMNLPLMPFEVGRYEAVFDAAATADLLRGTMGAATELDRALGYEANAGGTSYLNKPLEMLGTQVIAAPIISVYSDRSEKGGASTTKWDDEGVPPSRHTLVDKGVFAGYQSNREFAGWLHTQKDKNIKTSSGSSYSPTGVDSPLVHTGNISIVPGEKKSTFDTMVQDMKKGFAIKGMGVYMDFQQLNGMGVAGKCYEVVNGKITALAVGSGILFRAPELWKGVNQIGDASTVRRYGGILSKGEPPQTSSQSVYAVPIHHKEIAFIDILRKA